MARDLDPELRLAALARALGPLRRAQCALAGRLVATRGWERLGFARLGDYGSERLGRSARQLHDLARVDARLAELPGVEAALVSGALSWTKVRLVARVARAENQSGWVAFAERVSARALAREVRAVDRGSLEAGAPAGSALETDEDGALEELRQTVQVPCTPVVRAKCHRTVLLARRVTGEKLPPWQCMEAALAEWLSAAPLEEAVSGPGLGGSAAIASDESVTPASPGADAALAASPGAAPRTPAPVVVPASPSRSTGPPPPPEPPRLVTELLHELERADAFDLDRRLRAAVALEQAHEARLGPRLLEVARARLYRRLGYRNLESYARERLGMAPRKARALLRLERAAQRSPAIASAYREARLSWVQAHALVPLLELEGASEAGGESRIAAWVGRAERVSVRRLEDDVERVLVSGRLEEPDEDSSGERQTGAQATVSVEDVPPGEIAAGTRETARFFFGAPADLARLFEATLCSIRRRVEGATGRLPTRGDALERLLDHALATWSPPGAGEAREHAVFARDGWRCAVPGCSSYRNLHSHHIAFRSRGGGDELENRLTLCAWHHLRGVHAGLVRIRGRAPRALRFELGLRPDAPPLLAFHSGERRAYTRPRGHLPGAVGPQARALRR